LSYVNVRIGGRVILFRERKRSRRRCGRLARSSSKTTRAMSNESLRFSNGFFTFFFYFSLRYCTYTLVLLLFLARIVVTAVRCTRYWIRESQGHGRSCAPHILRFGIQSRARVLLGPSRLPSKILFYIKMSITMTTAFTVVTVPETNIFHRARRTGIHVYIPTLIRKPWTGNRRAIVILFVPIYNTAAIGHSTVCILSYSTTMVIIQYRTMCFVYDVRSKTNKIVI